MDEDSELALDFSVDDVSSRSVDSLKVMPPSDQDPSRFKSVSIGQSLSLADLETDLKVQEATKLLTEANDARKNRDQLDDIDELEAAMLETTRDRRVSRLELHSLSKSEGVLRLDSKALLEKSDGDSMATIPALAPNIAVAPSAVGLSSPSSPAAAATSSAISSPRPSPSTTSTVSSPRANRRPSLQESRSLRKDRLKMVLERFLALYDKFIAPHVPKKR